MDSSNYGLFIFNNTASQQYGYQALPAKGYFRLLHIQPGSEPLSCRLDVHSIAETSPSYDALSYAWDDPADVREEFLRCNDHLLAVPATVVAALYVIRDVVRTQTVWIDKICINQEDKDERGQQVMVMGSIYTNARRILVWLGSDGNNEAQQCFDLVHNTNVQLTSLISKLGDINAIPNTAIVDGDICREAEKWLCLVRMMNLKWFSRVWVLKEVGHARSVVLMYGKSVMNWSELIELMLLVGSRPEMANFTGNIRTGLVWDTFEDIWKPFHNEVTWKNELPFIRSLNQQPDSGGSLIAILNSLRAYDATDQRDRIYAFLSHPAAMRRDGSGKSIPLLTANYRVSVDDVYKEIAVELLRTNQDPWTLLSSVDHANTDYIGTDTFPSWVPRWDESYRVYWLGYAENWYRAGGTGQTFDVDIHREGQQTLLKLQGIDVGTINWISDCFEQGSLTVDLQKKNRPLQSVWDDIEQRQDFTAYGAKISDQKYAYHLLLSAGRAADEGPAEDDPDWHHLVFDQYDHNMRGGDRLSPGHDHMIKTERPTDSVQTSDPKSENLDFHVSTYISNHRRALTHRKIFQTSRGHFGVGHRNSRKGDICMVLRGSHMPFVLRRMLDENVGDLSAPGEEQDPHSNRYRLVGECYIQGLMRGQAFEKAQDGKDDEYVEAEITLE